MSADRSGFTMAVSAAAGFGFLAYFGRQLSGVGMSTAAILGWRFGLAAVMLGVPLALIDRRSFVMPPRAAVAALAMGAVGYAGQATLFLTAIAELKTGLASVLLYMNPALVALAEAALARRRPDAAQLAAVAAVVAGCALIVDAGDAAVTALGVAAGLGSALWYTCYILAGARLMRSLAPAPASVLVFAGAAFAFIVYGAFTGVDPAPPQAMALAALLGMVVVSTVMPVSLFLAAVGRIGSADAAIVCTLEPVMTLAVGALLLGEQLSVRQWSGAGLILAAVTALQLWQRRRVR